MGKDRISAYYNARVMPTRVNLQKIAQALDTTPEALLEDDSPASDHEAPPAPNGKDDVDLVIRLDGADIIIDIKNLRVSREAGPDFMAFLAKYLRGPKPEGSSMPAAPPPQ